MTARSLLREGDPEALKELISSEESRASARIAAHRETRLLVLNQHEITLPKGANENRTDVRSGIGRQQIDLLRGTCARRPTVRVEALEAKADWQKAAQEAENAYRELFPLLEMQQGGMPILAASIENALTYGLGIERIEYLPNRVSAKAGMPLGTGDKKDAFLKQQGLVTGQLPLFWTPVNPWNFMWRESSESGGLTLGIENRKRYVKELLENERYDGTLSKLRDWVDKRTGKDYIRALNATVNFWILDDGKLISYYCQAPEDYSGLDNNVQDSLQKAMSTGEIALQMPNFIGRPLWVLTKGLQSNDDDPRWRYYGMLEFSRSLIETLDTFHTAVLTHLKDFVFSPIIRTSELAITNGVATDLSAMPGGERPSLKLPRDGQTVVDLNPGEKLQFLQPAPLSPDFWHEMDSIERQIYRHGVSPSLAETDPNVPGYAMESAINTIMAKFEGFLNGVRLAAAQRVLMVHDQLSHYGERMYVQAQPGKRSKGNKATVTSFFSLDPEAFKEMRFSITGEFVVRKPTQTAADLQNAGTAQQIGYSFKDAVEKYCGETDAEQAQVNKLAESVIMQPQIQARILEVASKRMNLILDQQAAKQQGAVDPEQLAKVDPALLQALNQATPQGAPGRTQVDSALQIAGPPGQGPATPVPVPSAAPSLAPPGPAPAPTAAPAPPPVMGGRVPGGRSGRAAGQQRRPPTQRPAGGL